jgi:hypothetical protein
MCFFIPKDPVAPESVKGVPLCFGDVFDDVLDGGHAVRADGFPDRNVAIAAHRQLIQRGGDWLSSRSMAVAR